MPEPQVSTGQASPGTLKPEDEKKSKTEYEGKEINAWGKFFAGLFLILLTFLGCFLIVMYWPDRLPKSDEQIAPLYINEPFHVRLACLPDSCCPECIYDYKAKSDTAKKVPVTDTASKNDSINQAVPVESVSGLKRTIRCDELILLKKELLHINTLILILVALGGFVGNMIHIGTSFTTFIGSGKFKRSWLLWYCVKPFIAAALAIGIYFVFRGGFLNMSDGGAAINLYGLMTLSLFTGLFTDKATEKLKEIFEVIFRTRTERPDPLVGKPKITGITPPDIEKDKENILTLKGENLVDKKLIASINDEEVKLVGITKDRAIIKYTIPDTQKDKKEFLVMVKDEDGNMVYKETIRLKNSIEQPPVQPQPGSDTPITGGGLPSDEFNTGQDNPDEDDDDNDEEDESGKPFIKG
jgi:hypothetical protein